jgi:O-antigen/teichoic acid export membrane protein
MLLRAGAQAATLVLLARVLGASPYGVFVAIIAVAGLVVPLVGLGLSHIVLRNGARDPAHLPHYFRRAVLAWWGTLVPGCAVAMWIACLLLPSDLPLIAMLAAMAAELAATTLTELRARQQQAMHRVSIYGAINAGLPLLRLIVLGVLVWSTGPITLVDVLWAYAAASFAYIFLLVPGMCMPAVALEGEPMEAMPPYSGLPFFISALAMRLQGEFNKPILLQAGYDLAGNYNIAQRAVDIASLPLLALQEALWPRLYAQLNPLQLLHRTGLALLALAVLLGAVLWLVAPLLSWVVGPDYDGAIHVLRLLAWLPVLQVGRSLLNFHFIHLGRIALIGWASALGGVVGVSGVLAFVPAYGVSGAVATTYAAEAVMIAFLLHSTTRFVNSNQPVA